MGVLGNVVWSSGLGGLELRRLAMVAMAMGLLAGATGAAAQDYRQLNFALFDAAKEGRTQQVIGLLEQGASLAARNRFGNTALLLAARSAPAATVDALLDATAAISGAHLNPAVSLAFAIFLHREFPVSKLVPYWASQLAGAFLAGLVIFGLFAPFISRYEAHHSIIRGAPASLEPRLSVKLRRHSLGECIKRPIRQCPQGGRPDPVHRRFLAPSHDP